MNWGNRLVIVFICFAGLIATLVYKSMHTKFELVSKDYYGDELRYQEKIDGRANAAGLGPVVIEQTETSLIIHLPGVPDSANVKGEAWFYRSSNAVMDRKIMLDPAQGLHQVISGKELVKGTYQLKLSWQQHARQYYHESMITIR